MGGGSSSHEEMDLVKVNGLSFQKLKGRENYDTWKIGAMNYLIIQKLWKHVESESDSGEQMLQARSEIILMIEPAIYSYVTDTRTAFEAWKGLATAFDDSGTVRKVTILNQLVRLTYEETGNMEKYVNLMLLNWQKTRNAGFQIQEEVVASLMLGGLPEEFTAMVLGIENSGHALTVDYVKQILLQGIPEPRIKHEHEEHALAAKKGFTKKNNNMSQKNKAGGKKKSCYKCGSYFHFIAECPKAKMTCYGCGDTKHLFRNCPNPKRKTAMIVLFNTSDKNEDLRDNWFIDSGASAHMTNNKRLFETMKATENKEIIVANNQRLPIKGVGDIRVNITSADGSVEATIRNVNFVPEICTNLLSVNQLAQDGYRVIFNGEGCRIFRQREVMATGSLENGMYKLNIQKGNDERAFIARETINALDEGTFMKWHRKLGHPGFGSMLFLRAILGPFRIPKTKCIVCIKAKQARKPFLPSERESKKILELVHMDVCGPLPIKSLGGHTNFLTIIDDFSRKLFLFVMKSKTEVFDIFSDFVNMAEKQTGQTLKAIRTDNGTEFVNQKFGNFCNEKGVIHQRTIPYSPQQNGVAERYNRTIMERVRGMLLDSELGQHFWAEAAKTAADLINLIPKGNQGLSADEKWNGEKPNLQNLRIFGQKIMVHVPKEKRNKFEDRSKECIWMGYAPNGDRVYDPVTRKIEFSRDVIEVDGSKEEKALAARQEVHVQDERTQKEDEACSAEGTTSGETSSTQGMGLETGNTISDGIFDDYADSEEESGEGTFDYHVDSEEELISENPQTLKQAMVSPEAEEWKGAMANEHQSLMENRTWVLEELPKGKKAIKSKWVFTTKRDIDGNILRYKARLVAKGYSQVEGIDYKETFAPVVRYTSIRILLSIAANMNLSIRQMDAVTAYLNGTLDEEIYMIQPEGYDDGTGRCCKLVKSIYGLKQAGRVWNETLNRVLENFGLKRSKMDQCIYYSVGDRGILILTIYVDDILIFSNNDELEKSLRDELHRNFKMKDMGEVSSILGIRIKREKKYKFVTIDQEGYIKEILKRFKMTDCNMVTTPLDCNQKLTVSMGPQNKKEEAEMRKIPYRQAIGSLLFLSIISRPDISFAVNLLSRFCENPGKAHWGAIKRVFRYLKGTMKYKLTYGQTQDEVTGYCDADWAADLDQRKSTTGYVFTMYGGAVSWNSKRQPTIALSSTEAEYMSMVSAIQECRWIRQLLDEIFGIDNAITMYCDNKGAMQVFMNNSYSPRTKHMDIKDKFIREKMNDGEIEVKYRETNEMPADILTKAVSCSKLMKHLPTYGVNHGFI